MEIRWHQSGDFLTFPSLALHQFLNCQITHNSLKVVLSGEKPIEFSFDEIHPDITIL